MGKMWISWKGEAICINRIVEKFKDGIKKYGVDIENLHDPTDALLLASQASGLSIPELIES